MRPAYRGNAGGRQDGNVPVALHCGSFSVARDGLDGMLVIAPPDFPLSTAGQAQPLTAVFRQAQEWLGD